MEKLTISDLINLAMACTAIQLDFQKEGKENSAEKWKKLHDKVQAIYNEMNIE